MPPPSEERQRKRLATRFETFRIPGLRVPEVDQTGGAIDAELELSVRTRGAPSLSPTSGLRDTVYAPRSGVPVRSSSEAPTIPAPPSAPRTEYFITERAPPPFKEWPEEETDTLAPEEAFELEDWIDEDPSAV